MGMGINAEDCFRGAVISQWNLKDYCYLINTVNEFDVSSSSKEAMEFRKTFRRFWKVQVRDAKVWPLVFEALETIKEKKSEKHDIRSCFLCVLNKVSTGNAVNKSVASKVLATIDPSIAPMDRRVLCSLGLPDVNGNRQTKISESIKLFDQVNELMKKKINSIEGKKALKAFDEFLPDYKNINPVKKIDYFLWELGKVENSRNR